MRVLVTGATGFIASHLVPYLSSLDVSVVAVGHDPARLDRFAGNGGVEVVVADLRARDLAATLPAAADTVVHLAQANSPFPDGASDLWEVNAGSTARLLDWARGAGVRTFVLASTGSVYGTGDRSWRETDPAVGSGAYAATKIAAERIVAAYAPYMATVSLRLFAPYGPGQRGRMVPGIVNRVRTGVPVSLREGGRPRINPIYVADLVRILADATRLEGNHLINVGGPEVVSIADIAHEAGLALGVEPRFEEAAGSSGGDTIGDISAMTTVFGSVGEHVPFREGIGHVVAELSRAANAGPSSHALRAVDFPREVPSTAS